MNKEFFYTKIDKIFNNKKTNLYFKEQIDEYFQLKDCKINNLKYKIGDSVLLKKGMFMRGEGGLAELSDEKLKFISEYGFISPDVTDKYNPKQKTPLCIPVWNIQQDILLSDYINLYSGSTFLYTKQDDGYKYHTCLIPYKQLEKHIEQMRNEKYWMWRAEQTKEIRFMPNLAKDDPNVQIALIMDASNAKELTKKDIFNLDFDKDVLKQFIQEFFINDFINAERNDLTTNRESAVIFGIPSCFIEGILVGKIWEKDKEKLNKIKKYFPNCYICNLDGKVIKI